MKYVLSDKMTNQYVILRALYKSKAHIKIVDAYTTDKEFGFVNEIMQGLQSEKLLEIHHHHNIDGLFRVKLKPAGVHRIFSVNQNRVVIRLEYIAIATAVISIISTFLIYLYG